MTTPTDKPEPGPLRHIKHNQELKAQKEIRIHGGHQWDFFKDKATGLDLPKAA